MACIPPFTLSPLYPQEWIGFGMAPHNRKQDWWEGHLYIACIVWIMIVPLWIRYYA